MRLDKLSLLNFRNHVSFDLAFDGLVSVVVGSNAAGKTNILEAIYLLATGGSFRDGKIEEMVNFQAEVGHVAGKVKSQTSRVKINESADDEDVELRVVVTRGVVQGKAVSKRRLMVNGVGRSKQKFVGNLAAVVFRPEDLRIVEGSPGRRRKLMDEVLCQVDGEYGRCLGSYNKGLVRRNKVLQMIRDGKTNRSALLFWDQLVLKNGEYLQKSRKELESEFNKKDGNLKEVTKEGFLDSLTMKYEPSLISPARLQQYEEQEVYAGHTLVGPHRDDFGIFSQKVETGKMQEMKSNIGQSAENRNLAIYGSRGEQRLGVLWLKLRSLDFMQNKLGERPVLLLDDIFSELDHEYRKLVFEVMDKQQTIGTTADAHYIEKLNNAQVVEL